MSYLERRKTLYLFTAVLITAIIAVFSLLPLKIYAASPFDAKVYMTGKSTKKTRTAKMTYSKPSGTNYFRIYYKKSSAKKWKRISSEKYKKKYIRIKLKKNKTYNFKAEAYDKTGNLINTSRILKLKARKYANTKVTITGTPIFYVGDSATFKAKCNRYDSVITWEYPEKAKEVSTIKKKDNNKLKVKGLTKGKVKLKAVSENGYTKSLTVRFVDLPEEGDTGNKDIVTTAAGEIGYHEKASKKNLDSKTANSGSNNYTKYARDLGVTHGAWCSYFVSWCLWKNNYIVKGETKGLANSWRYPETLSLSIGKYYKNNLYIPLAGDIIMFDYEPNDFANHVGIVEKYEDGKIYTIEGNSSDQVKRRTYNMGNVYIMGITHVTKISDAEGSI